MILLSLPIIFINMGGEMVYILDQRLRAQNIPYEKASKVIHDIIGTMFHQRFLEELFKPQEVYTKRALRLVFDNLAHTSIMRLNANSMDKLYDLMLMAVKYQLLMCPRPSDILLITLNHLDSMRQLIKSELVIELIDCVYQKLIKTYSHLSEGSFQLIRQALLNFFQDTHIKISVLLKDEVQRLDGHFVVPINGPVPTGSELPGSIRHFSPTGEIIKLTNFSSGADYRWPLPAGSTDYTGHRGTTLGLNMYAAEDREEDTALQSTSKLTTFSTLKEAPAQYPDETVNPEGQAELALLAQLIGTTSSTQEGGAFKLNLFNTAAEDDDSDIATAESRENTVSIDASQPTGREELCRIMGDLTVGDIVAASKPRNLLEMLDEAVE